MFPASQAANGGPSASSASGQTPGPSTLRPVPHPLLGVGTLVEADVSKVWNTFDAQLGPRTFVELSNAITHAGKPLPKLIFSQLGGPLPNGQYTEVLELPTFSVGARYLLFFGRQASLYTPIWSRLAFRVERLANRSVVIGPEGVPVIHFGQDGVSFGRTSWLSGRPDHSRRTAGEVFEENVALADPEAANAIDAVSFVAAAKTAMASIGSPLESTVVLDPDPNVRWDGIPGQAQ